MKAITTISLDHEVLEEVKKMNINLSGELNDFLKTRLAIYNKDIASIDIQLKYNRRDEIKKQISELQAELNEFNKSINAFEMNKAKREEEMLIKEKEAIESMKHCKFCDGILTPARRYGDKYNICFDCVKDNKKARDEVGLQ